jgi:hypothetical protein
MISPIDKLIKIFYQWKVDILANITPASIAHCMKLKLLHDDLVRTHPLKPSNQPVIISFHPYDNNKFK